MISDNSIENATKDILLQIGIPRSIIGTDYIVEAVKLGIEDRNNLYSITKNIYPIIAEKFNTKASNVERAIRHAIDISWNKDRIGVLNRVFSLLIFVEKEKPCNSELIALFVEKIPFLISQKSA